MSRWQRSSYRRLTVVFVIMLSLVMAGVIVAARVHNNRYPPTITNSISLDAKIKFLRQNKQLFGARTVVTGSSVCLNNIDVDYLTRTHPDASPFVNLSAWGMQIEGTGSFLDFFLEHAPHVNKVVLMGQIVDFRSGRSESLFDRREIWAYISGKEDFLFDLRHFDLVKSFKNWKNFDRMSWTNRSYDGLKFDETGTVLLDLPESMLNKNRWETYGLDTETNETSFRSLETLCSKLRNRNIRFLFIVPPVREAYRRHASSFRALEDFKNHVQRIVNNYGGVFVDADSQLHLKDDCFIDMMHLNQRGARKVAELLSPLI